MNVTAEEVMTRDVVSVQDTITIQDLVKILFSKRVSGVPVVDRESRLLGIVSKTDLVTHGLERELSSILGEKTESNSTFDLPDFDNLLGPEPTQETVNQIMTTSVVTAHPSTHVSEIVRLMLDNKIHRVVITENEKVVGIVTSMDLLQLIGNN